MVSVRRERRWGCLKKKRLRGLRRVENVAGEKVEWVGKGKRELMRHLLRLVVRRRRKGRDVDFDVSIL